MSAPVEQPPQASTASRVMRAVPVASRPPADTVTATRYAPGEVAAKSNWVVPPTTVAVAAASSSTRAAVTVTSPAVPVTCGATSTLTREPAVSTTANDCTCGCASPSTRTESVFVVVAPRASPTVSVIAASCSPDAPFLVWASTTRRAASAMPSKAERFARPFSVLMSSVRPFSLTAAAASS